MLEQVLQVLGHTVLQQDMWGALPPSMTILSLPRTSRDLKKMILAENWNLMKMLKKIGE